jgi:hypothetical protein
MIPRVRSARRKSVGVVPGAVTAVRCSKGAGMRDCTIGVYGRTRMSAAELWAETDIG